MPDTLAASRLALKAATAAVILSSLLVAAKFLAWLEGGSASMLASLTDSAVDALVSGTNFLALRYAVRPADDDHRYGHGKAEGLAALGQSIFIAVSCALVVTTALDEFSNPTPVGALGLSTVILLLAIVSTLMLTRYQASVVKKSGSLAVEADSKHYVGDLLMNGGIIISLWVGWAFDWAWLDPVVALLVAAWLLYTARGIAVKAMHMLLDRELEDDVREQIIKLIRTTPGVEDMHDMRTRSSGVRVMISFDIEVEPTLTLIAAHDISRTVEDRILAAFPRAEVMIHIDPRGDITDSRHKKLKEFHGR